MRNVLAKSLVLVVSAAGLATGTRPSLGQGAAYFAARARALEAAGPRQTPHVDAPTLALGDIFVSPVGPRGLEYTDAARSLEGTEVAIEGFMVLSATLEPGRFMLAPVAVKLHDEEMGPCDDLPGATVFVDVPQADGRVVAFVPGPVRVVGTLSLGTRGEPAGRISAVRLTLASPGALTRVGDERHLSALALIDRGEAQRRLGHHHHDHGHDH